MNTQIKNKKNIEKKESPFANRDLNQQLRFPTLSWSSISAWGYSQEDWYDKYVLGNRSEPNENMMAGIRIGERWEADPTYLTEVERPEIFEHNLSAKLGDIIITGHIDGLHLTKKKKLQELKTTVSKTKWNAKSVREWGQITLYCYLLYENYKIKPEDLEIELVYVPVEQQGDFTIQQSGKAVVIPTVRTMTDIVKFMAFVKQTHKEMCEYVEQKKLSTPTS